jgi:hypothetical protein
MAATRLTQGLFRFLPDAPAGRAADRRRGRRSAKVAHKLISQANALLAQADTLANG